MKKKLFTIFTAISTVSSVESQTASTFENLTLPDTNSYWSGSENPMGTTFSSGNAIFPNFYDTSFGGFWASGWVFSNMQDSTTAGYTNMFSAITAIGNNNSANYAVCQIATWIGPEFLKLNSNAIGKVVNGFFITNSTYAALSMRDGDFVGKKFGGNSGNDPDWFKLTVQCWYNGNLTNDSVEFYLADFRFSDNLQDYILKDWQWVNLTSLGNVDSLQFNLSSSDVGQFGMNTPAYFCVDDLTTSDSFLFAENIFNETSDVKIFPNPFKEKTIINFSSLINKIEIYDELGKKVSEKINHESEIELSIFENGIYFIRIHSNNLIITKKIIKE